MSDLLLFGAAKKKASEELGEARTVWETLATCPFLLTSSVFSHFTWRFPFSLPSIDTHLHPRVLRRPFSAPEPCGAHGRVVPRGEGLPWSPHLFSGGVLCQTACVPEGTWVVLGTRIPDVHRH